MPLPTSKDTLLVIAQHAQHTINQHVVVDFQRFADSSAKGFGGATARFILLYACDGFALLTYWPDLGPRWIVTAADGQQPCARCDLLRAVGEANNVAPSDAEACL